jgi:hypothetical protein
MPLWVDEGLADYLTGVLAPARPDDRARRGRGRHHPEDERVRGLRPLRQPALIYNLGHAAFEFIESRWGKEGIRQFLFALRKSVIGGGDDAYEEAFQMRPRSSTSSSTAT